MTDISPVLNVDFIEAMYEKWRADETSVSREWRVFFQGFELGSSMPPVAAEEPCEEDALLLVRVHELVHRYRDLGHLLACLDPLSACPTSHPLLDLESFGLSADDLDKRVRTPFIPQSGEMTLGELVGMLRETYCRSVGVEYMHLQDPDERRWLQERMEPSRNRPRCDGETKLRMLNKLCRATLFEEFLHSRYVGQKRFSVEGAEALIALLDVLLGHAGDCGVREVVMGMSHRGRLNVQVNILGKPCEAVFCEFDDNFDPASIYGAGDVKYHTGGVSDVKTASGKPLRLILADNPSHLEVVNPVVEGLARGRQEGKGDEALPAVLPVLIHGDAAFAGQGLVAETMNLSQLEGYRTGGTVHIVVNNQIGFTTLPEDARSTRYSTDVAKMLMSPVFHVHGENPEAVAHVVKLACDYRMEFGKDVVVDIVCYRRHGHNEGDEPYYTQPAMYDRIAERPTVWKLYAEKLKAEGLIDGDGIGRILDGIKDRLEKAYTAAHDKTCALPAPLQLEGWEKLSGRWSDDAPATAVSGEILKNLARKMSVYPEGFTVHKRLRRILDRRLEAVEKGEGIDWAGAELLAFASLVGEGWPVRLSGQDSRRGTFSQRHAVLTDSVTGGHYTPLEHIAPDQARFQVFDSMLSESAVLGFEYGYSLVRPETLTLWEAQFGDFANNAQVIIDQFLVAGESKWRRLSGLTLLLPHGFEGQGAEHSSARLERWLQLCGEENIQVCYPTTPAQYFHLLRRQATVDFRKPLVVMSPKSLLRRPQAVSSLAEFTAGGFHAVLDDEASPDNPSRVLLCSGKIYYDLAERRITVGDSRTALVRVERLYPFPAERVKALTERWSGAEEWIWVQEEPKNMGAWSFVRPLIESLTGRTLGYVGRPEAASPATGHHHVHGIEQVGILDRALGPLRSEG